MVGCAGNDPTGADENAAQEESHSTFGWLRFNEGCATDIGASPDDTLWLIGCDTNPDGSIWYLKQNEGFVATNGRAGRITVDNGGVPWVTSHVNGLAFRLMVTDTSRPGEVMNPTLDWSLFGQEPVGDGEYEHWGLPNSWFTRASTQKRGNSIGLLFNHQDASLVSHTAESVGWCTYPQPGCYFYVNGDYEAFGSYEFGAYPAHELYEHMDTGAVYVKRTPAPQRIPAHALVNGTEPMWRTNTTNWESTGITSAAAIALFTPPRGASYQRVLWAVDGNGDMKMFDPTTPGFAFDVPRPPSYTWGLTDHFALGDDGTYQYDDASQTWNYFLPNTTPDGNVIVKLAYAGNQAGYSSSVWAIDARGSIYKAGFDFPSPR
jgi:hypothetical protein